MERSIPEGYKRYAGFIEEVLPETFWARLKRPEDLDVPLYNMEVELLRGDVLEEDKDLIFEGSLFDVNLKKVAEDRVLVDYLKFRRLPPFTEEEIAVARKSAAELAEKLGWG